MKRVSHVAPKYEEPRWGEITAIFGGTFDPPHLGHREAVKGLFSEPGVKEVLILPAANPPQKPANASSEARVAMARICFSRLPGKVTIDTSEIEREKREKGKPSFTFDTLIALRREGGGREDLAFVIGTDQLENLHTWHRFPEILGLCHWIVLERKGDRRSGERVKEVLSQWIGSGILSSAGSETGFRISGGISGSGSGSPRFLKLVRTEAPAISSTEIRETIGRTGEPPKDRLMPEIVQYLKENHLYGISNAS